MAQLTDFLLTVHEEHETSGENLSGHRNNVKIHSNRASDGQRMGVKPTTI